MRALLTTIIAISLVATGANAMVTISLSDLDLDKVEQNWSAPQRDRSTGGTPLSIDGRRFEHGLGTQAESVLAVRLDGGTDRFTAWVGVDDHAAAQATVDFHIYGDGKLLWSSGVMRKRDAAKCVDVDLKGVQMLELWVMDTGNSCRESRADWADAEFLVSGARPVAIDLPKAGTCNEKTPSIPHFFAWISSGYEGPDESKTLANLDFFKWLHDEFGMQLEIYAWDVTTIDSREYGTMSSDEFKQHFPNGWKSCIDKAKSFDCRMGVWLGPDGYGNTPAEEAARKELIVSLCRDYQICLFKYDLVCGALRPEKQQAFIDTLVECRKFVPDLIVQNERLSLGRGRINATTYLWDGIETYIDVFMPNTTTAPHHRAGAIARPVPKGLRRLIEDHGVCLSSYLDYWEDDLILQAFNRCMLLAPQLYGNPWLLRDDEFPKLARIFNLHYRNRDILINGMLLPEAQYGPNAVARGDGATRFLTLRNLTWHPITYNVKLDEEIGLTESGNVRVRRYHPSERVIGTYKKGDSVTVEVAPFRSYMLMATVKPCNEIGVEGCDYEVVRDTPGKPAIVKLLGMPGTSATVGLPSGFASATLDGKPVDPTKAIDVRFPGSPLTQPYHRKLDDLRPCAVPTDAEALYEATCFAADSNCLEARCLDRSGPTKLPQVQGAREAYFKNATYVELGIWDRACFDDSVATKFTAQGDRWYWRVDLGAPTELDRIVFTEGEPHRDASKIHIEASSDLSQWISLTVDCPTDTTVECRIPNATSVRYIRASGLARSVSDISGYNGLEKIDRSLWRASNLLKSYAGREAKAAWSTEVTITESVPGSYLAVALDGKHGIEGAYVALRVAGKPIGAPDRALCYAANAWESPPDTADSNYTYYIPITDDMIGKPVEVIAIVMKSGINEFKPEVWITAPPPYQSHVLELTRSK